MINKLEDIRDDVVDGTADYLAGAINLATLNDALSTLGAFDNQLAAKIGNGQIVNPEAQDLLDASAELRAMIASL